MTEIPMSALTVAHGIALDVDDNRLMRLMRKGPMTRGELAERTGWARNTVVSKIEKLTEKGLLRQAEVTQADRGRPSLQFEIVGTASLFFVVVFQETLIAAAICTLTGEPLAVEQRPISGDFGPEDAVRAMVEMLGSLSAHEGVDRDKLNVCIVGVQGPVSEYTRTIPWSRVGVLPTNISEILGMKVIVENDANLMAIGAHRMRGDVDNMVMVVVATGIGAGIIVEGNLHRGVGGWAGEIGHVPIPAGGDMPCVCGGRGCAAGVASNGALITAVSTPLRPIATIEELQALAFAGDLDAIFALRAAGRHIGEAILGLMLGLSPEVVLIGGLAAQIGDHMVAGVRELLTHKTPAAFSSKILVESAPDHLVVELLGASTLGFEALFPSILPA